MEWSRLFARRAARRRTHVIPPLPEVLETRTVLAATGIGTFEALTGEWALRSDASAGEADAGTFQFGDIGSATLPVTGDWNGDGQDDIGTFDRNTGTWTLRFSTNAGAADASFQFGAAGTLPVVGDWDNDGTDDIGVFDPRTAIWSLHVGASAGQPTSRFRFGKVGTVPVVGDWNGDGVVGIGVFDPATNQWSLRQKAKGGPAQVRVKYGQAGTEAPVVGDWNGDGRDGIGTYRAITGEWRLRETATAGSSDAGSFTFGDPGTVAVVGNFQALPTEPPPTPVGDELLTLSLKPLDLDLLGLRIQSSTITATVSTVDGDGKLLGNLLSNVGGLVNVEQINQALNNVLGTTIDLLNSIDLQVSGVGTGVFDTAPTSVTPLLQLTVAPVHLDVLGAQVDTSPITVSLTAEAGEGRVLGNVLTSLTDLFNPPLPDQLDLAFVNAQLTQLLSDLEAQIPSIPSATVPPPELADDQIVSLTVPAIDLNLLGLELETTPITVDATAQTGDGLLLGNILSLALDTVGATPEQTRDLNANINNILGKVVGVLNASTITLPANALDGFSAALQSLALPDLITASPGASAQILDLVISSTDGTTPPVQVDLLGLHVETSDIDAQLSATTGEGQVLGNLLYNVANLLNPGGPAALISLISDLASGADTTTGPTQITGSGTLPNTPTEVLTIEVPPLNLDLLGLHVQSGPITVTVSAQEGDGKLLGNTLTAISTLVNTQGVSTALNSVLSSVVTLVNSVDLNVSGVLDGAFSSAAPSNTPILQLQVAPVHLDLLGALVDTGPITLTITAEAGEGLVLGNVLTELTDLFNPPLPASLDLAFINSRLSDLLADLQTQLPGIPSAEIPPATWKDGQILNLTIPSVNLDLLGLTLDTSPITVDATAETGDGLLLGNLLTVVLSTLDATPAELQALSANLNGLLAKVVGVLNASMLTLPEEAITSLAPVLQTLSLPDLISGTQSDSTVLVDLTVHSSDGVTPPVLVDLMGLHVETSDIDIQIGAHRGDGLILGNLIFNVANILNADSPATLLYLLTQLR